MLPEVSQSENYRITADVLNEGGEPGSSQNYVMSMDAIGEAIEAGESNSANYRIYGSLGVAVILDISGHAPCDFAAK
jgi:hypothetical protein